MQVESAQAEFTAATSNLADAAAEEARYANLKTHATVSAADYDHKKAAKDEAQGRLERAQRALDLARNQLDYAELKIDVDGVITATLAEPGQVVNIGQAVARLAHHGEKEALVALSETWLEEARKSEATVSLWANPDRSFKAHLRELSPQADPTTRTYAARFTIENPDDTGGGAIYIWVVHPDGRVIFRRTGITSHGAYLEASLGEIAGDLRATLGARSDGIRAGAL